MSYLGTPPQSGFITTAKQRVTSSTNNYVDLDNAISSLADVIVWVNFVKQDSTNLSLTSSTRITLGGTLVSSDIVEIAYLGKAVNTQTPGTATVTNDMLAGSIAQSKLSDEVINEAKLQVSNNPTNGYMLTAQSGNTGGLTWAEAGSGGLVLTSSGTTSGSANTITLTNAFSSTYQTYLLIINRLQTPTDDSIFFQYGVGGTADTSSDSIWTMLGMGNDGTELRHYSHQTSGGYDNFMRIGKNVDADSDVGFSCALWLHNPNTTNTMKMYHGTVAQPYSTATNIAVYSVSGAKNDTTQFDSIRIGTENGYTIRSGGTVRVYGVVNA